MFKSARWRGEKNKIKGVFKLHFHATQLGQLGGDALILSVIPVDIGKPTTRLEKAKVRDGSCYWEKPLYETMKFSQDPKTGKVHEKIYRFVVTKDSSRFGGIGEVSIDFANYAESAKLNSLSLPLKNANSEAVLHVLIQKMQGSFDQRDFDEIENTSHRDQSLWTHFDNRNLEGSIERNPTKDHGMANGISRDRRASIGSDSMLSRSDSGSGMDTPSKHELKNNKLTHESSLTRDRSLRWDSSNGSAPKLSTDDSSVSTLGENPEEGSLQAIIQKLQTEVVVLTRQADVSQLELQTLRKQIVKEMKKSQDLSREVATLKEECERLKECQYCAEEVKVEVKVNDMLLIDEGDPWVLLEELRQELSHEKELSSNLHLQLQKMQEEKSNAICLIDQQSHIVDSKPESDDEEQRELEAIVREHSGAKETYILEQKIIQLYNEIELYKRDKDELEMQMEQIALDYEILKQENHDMSYKLERSQLEEQLKFQYECTTSYATVDELETQIESLKNDLKSKSKELSKSTVVIKELESHIKNLEEELDNQAHEYEVDLEELMCAKTKQEKRAIQAEDNLRKMRLQNANAATRLQEELRRLSQKMASTFEVNEKASMKAMEEANKLRVEKQVLENTLEKVKNDLEHLRDCFHKTKVFLENQLALKSEQLGNIRKQIADISGELELQKETSRAEIQRLNMRIENLESERSMELVSDSSEDLFLHKEKDLQLEIRALDTKLDVLL
uniref:probable DNA double-strand break repair Rad50 ATPase n=1 Tax=Erigeron canadensis TaxID=72917 RepID=UPI001CB8D38F|nr:probable DNA double-strand break repair Rad50 ATPase [Erigeron canadensis]